MPIWISKTSEDLPTLLAAYATATSRSKVVLMNALSMPPLTPCSFGRQKLSGSRPPATPR